MTSSAPIAGEAAPDRWEPQVPSLRWSIILLPLLLGLGLYVVRVTALFTAVPGDLGDGRFNSIVLEHFYRLLTGADRDIWTMPFFYPFQGTLAFSDNLFGSAPLYALFRLLGAPRALATDLWFTAGFVLNYAAAYHVSRRLGFSVPAAAFAAFAFTFALPMLAQETHVQLVYRFAAPLAFLSLWEAFRQRRLMLLGTALFWLAVEFYCSIYLGVFLAMLLGSAGILLLVSTGGGVGEMLRSPLRERPLGLVLRLLLAGIGIGALGYLLHAYWYYANLYGFVRSWETISAGLPRLWSYAMADHEPDIAPLLSKFPAPLRGEQQLFFGYPLILLALLGTVRAVRSRHRLGWLSLLVTAIIFVGTLFVFNRTLYWFVWWLPGLNALRVLTRIVLVQLVPITLLAALAVDWLIAVARSRAPTRGIALVVLALAGLGAVAEVGFYAPVSTPIADWTAVEAAVTARLPQPLPHDAVLLLAAPPGATRYWPTDVTAMMVAQDLGIATLNGYSGNNPPGHVDVTSCVTPAQALAGYFRFAATPPDQQQALLARVIRIASPPDAASAAAPVCPP